MLRNNLSSVYIGAEEIWFLISPKELLGKSDIQQIRDPQEGYIMGREIEL